MTQKQLFRVVFPSQDLFIRQQIMNAGVAFLANPQAASAHLLDSKAPAESLIAVATARNEVVKCQKSTRVRRAHKCCPFDRDQLQNSSGESKHPRHGGCQDGWAILAPGDCVVPSPYYNRTCPIAKQGEFG